MHFALICLPFKSHIAVFETLGQALQQRGHRVSLLVNSGAETEVRSPLPVYPIAGTSKRQIDRLIKMASRPNGPLGVLKTVHGTAGLSEAFCRHAPERLRALGVDAVLGDQMEPAAGLVARYLGLPLISIACAVALNRDEGIPLPFLPWPYDKSPNGVRRNRGGERIARLLLTEQRRLIMRWSARFGLKLAGDDLQSCFSEIATIAQTTESFDFPRTASSRGLHMVGPLRRDEPQPQLPFAIDPSRPFVFMSLGTLQGHRFRLFRAAARACRQLDVQLLVAHCGGLTEKQEEKLGATWVTDFAPQRAVLERADLCITHGGVNTVMDALECGVPLIALPIAFDQPGVAARIVHHGVGVRLSATLLTAARMKAAIRTVLSQRSYTDRATQIGRSIAEAGGLNRAADIIENVLADYLQKDDRNR
ncbi:glycosyltransferase [Neorhizobium sp. NPDC001467]|uniref:glycosyltransferase n=1 Tax=Neorhizobium sp. NPDC001467 TaxID=3390595 RepID=UPI003D07A7F1